MAARAAVAKTRGPHVADLNRCFITWPGFYATHYPHIERNRNGWHFFSFNSSANSLGKFPGTRVVLGFLVLERLKGFESIGFTGVSCSPHLASAASSCAAMSKAYSHANNQQDTKGVWQTHTEYSRVRRASLAKSSNKIRRCLWMTSNYLAAWSRARG